MKALRVLLTLLLLAFAGAAAVRGGDDTCHPIPVTWYSPTGIAGCTLDGPTVGVASWYSGSVAAANWCTWPFDGCGLVAVQSHRTGLVITVPIGMFGDLYTGTPNERLVDLTRDQVLALGLDPADGVFDVTVTPLAPVEAGGGLPDTATAEAAGGWITALLAGIWLAASLLVAGHLLEAFLAWRHRRAIARLFHGSSVEQILGWLE